MSGDDLCHNCGHTRGAHTSDLGAGVFACSCGCGGFVSAPPAPPAPVDHYAPQKFRLASMTMRELLKLAASALRTTGDANSGATCPPTNDDLLLAAELERRA